MVELIGEIKKRLTKNPINSQALQPKPKPSYILSDAVDGEMFKVFSILIGHQKRRAVRSSGKLICGSRRIDRHDADVENRHALFVPTEFHGKPVNLILALHGGNGAKLFLRLCQ